MLTDKKILVTGVTGMAPMPVAEHLAQHNEVWGVSRFTNAQTRRRLEDKGIRTCAIDLAGGDLSDLPNDFTHLLLCAHARLGGGEFHQAVEVNAVSAGRIMQHCSQAEAAIVFSSGSIYSINKNDAYYPFTEMDDIGRAFPPWAPTSPLSKASLEAVARFCAEGFNLPTTIVRLNIVYGPGYGMPFMDADAIVEEREIPCFADPYPANLIHSDDMCDQIEAMFDAASIPALIVNWCGDDVVTRRAWIERAAQLSGKVAKVKIMPTPETPSGSVLDAARRRSITGPCKVRFWESFEASHKQRYGQ